MFSPLRSSFLVLSLIFTQAACATSAGGKKRATLEREEHQQIVRALKTPALSGKFVRIITDENHEVPDPARPQLFTFPNGKQKYVIGFSGQNIMVVDSLEKLVRGGIWKVDPVTLTNEAGHQFGGEIDPQTGKPYGYAFDSSTWDIGVFRFNNAQGASELKVLAGAMGTGTDGKPLLIKDGHNNTRQRLFFSAEFREVPANSGKFRLFAGNPKAPLNKGMPVDGNWIEKNQNGEVIFSHGYGGEPVTLQNGDLYLDERGWVPFVYETVVEQRNVREQDGSITKVPYRTAIVLAYLDPTLSKVMEPAKIIFDVFKPDGSLWKATQRPTAGPLVEGAHIEVQHEGKPVMSMAEVNKLRKSGKRLDYQMLFSAGEYFGHYGSFLAYSEGNLSSFKPQLNAEGELDDITAPLRVLFTWIGRPVSFHVGTQEYLMLHGVDRSSLPEGIHLDQLPKHHEWQYFKRQEIVVPVERSYEKGVWKLRMQDDSGLIEKLKRYVPRKVSKIFLNDVMIAA